jgi:hypothetical protein
VTAFPHEPLRRDEDLAPTPEGIELFARVEDLVGQEDALLTIPAKARSDEQHTRLAEIGRELDRIFEKLRDRAQRAGRRVAEGN